MQYDGLGAGTGDVTFSPSRIREIAAGYEDRGSTAASSALSALSGAQQFPLPAVAQQIQTSVESLLASLAEVPQLLGEMTQSFSLRATSSAQAYEEMEERNTSLAKTMLGEQP